MLSNLLLMSCLSAPVSVCARINTSLCIFSPKLPMSFCSKTNLVFFNEWRSVLLDLEGEMGFALLWIKGKQSEEGRWHKPKYKIKKYVG